MFKLWHSWVPQWPLRLIWSSFKFWFLSLVKSIRCCYSVSFFEASQQAATVQQFLWTSHKMWRRPRRIDQFQSRRVHLRHQEILFRSWQAREAGRRESSSVTSRVAADATPDVAHYCFKTHSTFFRHLLKVFFRFRFQDDEEISRLGWQKRETLLKFCWSGGSTPGIIYKKIK